MAKDKTQADDGVGRIRQQIGFDFILRRNHFRYRQQKPLPPEFGVFDQGVGVKSRPGKIKNTGGNNGGSGQNRK